MFDLKESREGFCRRGMGRTIPVEVRETEEAVIQQQGEHADIYIIERERDSHVNGQRACTCAVYILLCSSSVVYRSIHICMCSLVICVTSPAPLHSPTPTANRTEKDRQTDR